MGYSFRLPKGHKCTKHALSVFNNFAKNCAELWKFGYNELQNVVTRNGKAQYLATGTKKGKILSNLLEKVMENLCDHGCLKIQELVEFDKEKSIWSRFYLFRTRLHLGVQYERQKCLATRQCSTSICIFYFLICVLCVSVMKPFKLLQIFCTFHYWKNERRG